MFVFILLLGLTREVNALVLITLLYIPVICGSALVIGPVQSFALSHLPTNLNPHGVTMVSTGFQIAGCVGSSLFTGVYALVMSFSDLSTALFITLLVAVLIALVGFVISLKVRKCETEVSVKHEKLESIMKKDIYKVEYTDSLTDVMKYITDKRVSGVPVMDKDKLVGFISDGDIMRYLAKAHPLFTNAYFFSLTDGFDEKLNDLMQSKVIDVAKKKIVTIDINTGLEEVCRILVDKHLKKAPVMKNGKMVGIINRSDITKYAMNEYLTSIK